MSTRQKHIIFQTSIIFILIFLFIELKPSYSQLRRSGKIFPWAFQIEADDEWYVSCETIDGTVWWWNDYYLTTQHGSDQTSSREGDGMINPGFHACDDWQPTNEPVVAYGIYKFTFHFPNPPGWKIFFLDIRDADWAEGYSGSPDLDIRWNNSMGYFQYKNSVTNDEWEEMCDHLDTVKIWVLFGIDDGDETKDKFQPTPPRNFECTNSKSTGQNPEFDWDVPSQPDGVTFKYKIYRSENMGPFSCITSGFTSTNWTDTGVTIDPSGSNYWYYATAYTDNSPDSDQSDIAKIKGNPEKALP